MNGNVFNKVSRTLVLLAATVVIIWNTIDYILDYKENNSLVYNYVELKVRFKRCVVINKYEGQDSKYIFDLINPITKTTHSVKVTENLYYNVYFVGDTIR